jgi:hypothetical protein
MTQSSPLILLTRAAPTRRASLLRGPGGTNHERTRNEDSQRHLKGCDRHVASRFDTVRSRYAFVTESGVRCLGAKFDMRTPSDRRSTRMLAPATK